MAGRRLNRPFRNGSGCGGCFLRRPCPLLCGLSCLSGILAFQFPFLCHAGERVAGKLRVFLCHLLKIQIGPCRQLLSFPFRHPAGRVLTVAASGKPGELTGSCLCHKLGFMGSFHAYVLMLNLVYFVVGVKPYLRPHTPDSLLCQSRLFGRLL